MFKVIKYEGKARRGKFQCAHGGEADAGFRERRHAGGDQGGVSALDLAELGCQIELSNTYHLHLRPVTTWYAKWADCMFMHWDGLILTDPAASVCSPCRAAQDQEEGVTFASHLDGRRIFMGPEESMRIQSNLGSDIVMAFDEWRIRRPAKYAKDLGSASLRWLERAARQSMTS